MFDVHHLHHPLPGFFTVLLWLHHAPRLPLCYPLHGRTQLSLEHQAVINLRPVLIDILSTGSGKVLRTSVQSLLHQHPVST